ncbi:adenylosuccinate synthetase [Granulicella sp. S190]|uniref:adenylosuccinate synthetase n=1 Tax=Granulicella sp. S190 TaxID=1747226 RepID=UPI00131AB7D2|nr:adenylosuccinate synthetase [Granulicella sp. S190]
MSVWVVVGGQFGSEGKGKIAAAITLQEGIELCVRCGGPNSGHSFVADSGEVKLVRQLPTGFVSSHTRLLIPAGAYIDEAVLKSEITDLGLTPARVGVDRNAVIITAHDRESERALGLREAISSTLSGVGAAVARRVMRGNVETAGTSAAKGSWLAPYIVNVAAELNAASDAGRKILIEGTQGYGLSVYHADEYPKATSRDTTAAGFISEVGLSPRLITDIVLVIRTFPIRVSGAQAGSLRGEIDWATVQRESSYPHPIPEFTTVTKSLRRVGRFDMDMVRRAVITNRPTSIAVNGLDLIDYSNYRQRDSEALTPEAKLFIRALEDQFGVPVTYFGTSPFLSDVVAKPGRIQMNLNGVITPDLAGRWIS